MTKLELILNSAYTQQQLKDGALVFCEYNPIREYYIYKKDNRRLVFKKLENNTLKFIYEWDK